jgi:U6 snRNA-associated Sm-like protein LSm7
MADRPYRGGRGGSRGGRGGGEGGGGRGGRGGSAAGGGGGAQGGQDKERPKKENILDLKKYMDKRITVKFNGGREGSFLSLFYSPSPTTPTHPPTTD